MKRKAICATMMLLGMSSAAFAWTSVGDGIEYQAFTTADPNNLYVTRMARSNTNAIIDTSIGDGILSGSGFEVMTSQAARQDDALSWWGQSWGATNNVVAAINGGFYDGYGILSGGMIQSGWYSKFFADSFSGFTWNTSRTPFIGECVTHQAAKVYVKFMNNNNTMVLDGINVAPAASNLIIFTPQYNNQTPSGTRTEVLVEMSKPNVTTTGTGYSSGTVRWKGTNTGSTWIPFDHLVLSADGSDGTTLNNNASVGSTIRVYQELYDENEPDVQGNYACQTATGRDWSNAFSTINSNFHFLKNNVVRVPDAVAHPGYQGYVDLNPRTAICYNSSYVFFVICDGRSAQSEGMSCAQLGTWCKNTLGATDGVNLDGGGSSELVVNGSIMNDPSDGSERAVCNGVVMVNVQAMQQSTTFTSGQNVTTSGSANMRLGPGTNYGIRTTLSAGANGTIVAHSINGVYAKGYNWWKCDFGGITGWVAESLLGGTGSAPTITTHPSPQTVGVGQTATFNVGASGTSPLSYQWQKNSVNLSNGGHYSGCTTATLTVSTADTNDQANYRCVVSNAYGSATSNQAYLTVTTCQQVTITNGDFEGGNTNGVGTGWTGYQRATNPTTVWSIQTASPAEGLQYQQIANTTATGGGGVRQDVINCTVGNTYTIAGWMRTNSGSATAQVKVSPTASTNWATAVDLSPAQITSSSTWVQFSGTIVATGTSMTIWLDGHTGGTDLNKTACFDGVTITGCGGGGGGCTDPTLTNGNFETSTAANPPAGWTTYIQSTKSGNWTIQTATPPQGTQWQQTQVYNASSWGGVRQNVTGLVAGEIYTISGTYKSNSTSATASIRYNLSGNTNRTNSTALATTASTSWTTFSSNVTASGTSLMLFLDHLNGTSTNKAGAFDNIKVICAP